MFRLSTSTLAYTFIFLGAKSHCTSASPSALTISKLGRHTWPSTVLPEGLATTEGAGSAPIWNLLSQISVWSLHSAYFMNVVLSYESLLGINADEKGTRPGLFYFGLFVIVHPSGSGIRHSFPSWLRKIIPPLPPNCSFIGSVSPRQLIDQVSGW